MRGLKRKKEKEPAPSRAALLAAVPMRHPGARERVLPDEAVELSVPVRRTRLGRWLSGRDDPVIRRFELDRLGAEVWRMVDGSTTVRGMIEAFGTAHRLNLREAEVSILAYLRTLATKGIMALSVPVGQGPRDADGESPTAHS